MWWVSNGIYRVILFRAAKSKEIQMPPIKMLMDKPGTADVQWYIHAARQAMQSQMGRPPSNRQLCERLGASHNAIITWLDGTIPTEGLMIRFADLIGLSHEEALLDRKVWTARDSSVATAWKKIAAGYVDRFKSEPPFMTILGPLLALLFVFNAGSARASDFDMRTSERAGLYIMESKWAIIYLT
jgi:hypothetical protein